MSSAFEYRQSFGRLTSAVREGARAAVAKIAFDAEAEAKRSIMQGSKSGRTYRRGAITRSGGSRNTKLLGGLGLQRNASGRFIVGYRFHQASAPSEAPANDLGALANSIVTTFPVGSGGLLADTGPTVDYGETLEEGSPGGKIAPRPFLAPAAAKVSATAAEVGARLIAREIRSDLGGSA